MFKEPPTRRTEGEGTNCGSFLLRSLVVKNKNRTKPTDPKSRQPWPQMGQICGVLGHIFIKF